MPYFSAATEKTSIPAIIEPKLAALGMERWLEALKACSDKKLFKHMQ